MDRKIIKVGNKTYNCQIAKTEEEKKKGLLDYDYLSPDEGLLFEWNSEDDRPMHMKGMKFPIDQIGINDDDEVTMVYHAFPTEEQEDIIFPNARYILEVNQDSGIVEGDEFEIDDSDDLNKYVMKVLAPDGSTQMYLQGGERIISRVESRTLIRKAKKAYENKNKDYDRYCKSLGKYIFKVLKGQNERPPEYVEVPEGKDKNSDDKNS